MLDCTGMPSRRIRTVKARRNLGKSSGKSSARGQAHDVRLWNLPIGHLDMEHVRLDPMIAPLSDLQPISAPVVIAEIVLEVRRHLIGVSVWMRTRSSARSACSHAIRPILSARMQTDEIGNQLFNCEKPACHCQPSPLRWHLIRPRLNIVRGRR